MTKEKKEKVISAVLAVIFGAVIVLWAGVPALQMIRGMQTVMQEDTTAK